MNRFENVQLFTKLPGATRSSQFPSAWSSFRDSLEAGSLWQRWKRYGTFPWDYVSSGYQHTSRIHDIRCLPALHIATITPSNPSKIQKETHLQILQAFRQTSFSRMFQVPPRMFIKNRLLCQLHHSIGDRGVSFQPRRVACQGLANTDPSKAWRARDSQGFCFYMVCL